jgi:hypothetical protein
MSRWAFGIIRERGRGRCRPGRDVDVVHGSRALGRRRLVTRGEVDDCCVAPGGGLNDRLAGARRVGPADRRRLADGSDRAVHGGRHLHRERRWHGPRPGNPKARPRVRSGVVARWASHRLPGLPTGDQPERRDLRDERRRHQPQEPDEGSSRPRNHAASGGIVISTSSARIRASAGTSARSKARR